MRAALTTERGRNLMSDETGESAQSALGSRILGWGAAIGFAVWFGVPMISDYFALRELSTASATAPSSTAPAKPATPEVCVDTYIGSHFVRDPSDKYGLDTYSSEAQALMGLITNGNYTVEDLISKAGENGLEYCYAKLRIVGIYEGNSYNTRIWAMTHKP